MLYWTAALSIVASLAAYFGFFTVAASAVAVVKLLLAALVVAVAWSAIRSLRHSAG